MHAESRFSTTTFRTRKGKRMKTYLLRIMLPVLAFAALALTAKAQDSDQLTVTIPYEFVVGNKTLPAGTYRLNHVSDLSDSALVLSSFENRTGVVVLPSVWESARAGKAGLIFEHLDGQYFLTRIDTAEHVFAIPVSKSALLLASKKSNQNSAG